MAEIIGDTGFAARLRRILDGLTWGERSHVRRVIQGGERPGYRAMSGGQGDVTIYSAGETGGDELVGAIVSHENHHLAHGIDEDGAVAAEAATLRRQGRDDLARAIEANAASPAYREAIDRHWGSSSVASTEVKTQAQAVDDWMRGQQNAAAKKPSAIEQWCAPTERELRRRARWGR